jgi:hypothetical protein
MDPPNDRTASMGAHVTTIRTSAGRGHRFALSRVRRKADECGLTTLEWLLIVAAVAGLAALAVVLVQNVVDDTAEQLGGASARETAANVAADTVIREAKTAQPSDARFNTWQKWELYFTARCERLEILYSDTNLDVEAIFHRPTGKSDDASLTSAELNAADDKAATATKPQTSCKRAGATS